MNGISLIIFYLGLWGAGVFAVGLQSYPCGLPLLMLALAVSLGMWCQSNRAAKVSPTLGLIIVTVGYMGWRMMVSPNADFARTDGLLLAGALLSFWFAAFHGSADHFPRVLLGFWALFVANMGVAVWEDWEGENVYQLLGEKSVHGFASGLYYHYNHFANLVLGIGLLSLGYGLAGRMKWPIRVLSLLMYGLAVYGIYLSRSRGAWLGLGCGTALAFLGWLVNLHRTKARWRGPVLILALTLTPLLVFGALQMGSKAVSNRTSNDGGRLEFASIAVDLILEKPFLGGGSRSYFYDSFRKLHPNELSGNWPEIQYVHNEYLQAAVDYGLVGAGLLLAVMIAVFFRGIVMMLMGDAKSPGERGVALGSMAALCAMGVQAFFSFVYHVLPDVILMGFCMGCLVRQPWILSETQTRQFLKAESHRFHWGHGLTGVVLGLAVMAFAARDAAAWLTCYPRMNHNEQDLLLRAERMKNALEIRPDFIYYSSRAALLSQARQSGDLSEKKKAALIQEAITALERVVERAPDSYPNLLHLAMLYDLTGEYEKSASIYLAVMPILKVREASYGTQFLYARNMFYRAQAAWHERQPKIALGLFLQAREQLRSTKVRYSLADPSLMQVIEKCIAFLESAGIQVEER